VSGAGPPLFIDPDQRAVGNALLGLLAQDGEKEPQGWAQPEKLRTARDVLDAQLQRVASAEAEAAA
jgi:hypothetical protein